MIVVAIIVEGALTPESQARALAASGLDPRSTRSDGAVGATLRFEGIVRRDEPHPEQRGEPRALLGLEYQTYDPMAQRGLESLARAVAERHGLASIVVWHSRGRVGVGEVSFVLEISAAHRAETLAATASFIDAMKRDVPIWKSPVWA
ncbi:MAG: molybdenum cofactor biosynthesis protein MoaE [Phycisphaerales bacterium]|nr:MAG: molybdenum cofactor biosynthesis protein MoaE [Phycisphaerales bacterium]